MKLLIITQAVDTDDPILGFFHDWLLEFSKKVEVLTVICLREGKHTLPPHVRVFSLGKESRQSRIQYLFRFYHYIFREKKNYDSVFVHMNPEYVVLGGVFWRIFGKNIVLWYTHRQITWKLRVATFLSNTILTAAKESFRLKSNKVHVVGHGIDVHKFGGQPVRQQAIGDVVRIVTVGRVTPIKNIDILIEAIARLVGEGVMAQLTIVGAPVQESDWHYLERLQDLVAMHRLQKVVTFLGELSHDALPKEYRKHDISINLTPSGGVDKVVLESMAAQTIPLTSNSAFRGYFGEYAPLLLFKERNVEDLVTHIKSVVACKNLPDIRQALYAKVEQEMGLDTFIKRVTAYLV